MVISKCYKLGPAPPSKNQLFYIIGTPPPGSQQLVVWGGGFL